MNTQPKSNVPTDAERAEAIKQAKWDSKVKVFEGNVDRQIEAGKKAAAELVEAIQTQGVSYAIQWRGSGAVKYAEEQVLWAEVYRLYNDEEFQTYRDPVRTLRAVLKNVEQRLLKNWVRESSSSEFANVVSGAKAEAYASFHSDATSIIEYLQSDDS